MSKVYKIGLVGTKNVGKTTLATQLVEELKTKGLKASLVREAARDCPLPINRSTTIESAFWLLGTQMAREAVCAYASSIVICDRTALDVMPFLRLSFGMQAPSDQVVASEIRMFGRLIKDYLAIEPYDEIFYLEKCEAFWDRNLSLDEVRFRRELDSEFRKYLSEAGVHYRAIPGTNTAERLAKILDIILMPINLKCNP